MFIELNDIYARGRAYLRARLDMLLRRGWYPCVALYPCPPAAWSYDGVMVSNLREGVIVCAPFAGIGIARKLIIRSFGSRPSLCM